MLHRKSHTIEMLHSREDWILKVISWILLISATLVVFLPLIVIVSSSFKTEAEIFSFPMTLIPDNPIVSNFLRLKTETVNFPLYIFNSFKVTILIVVLQLATAATGGYVFSKMKWPFRDTVFLMYISTMMVPIQVYIISQFIVIRNLNLMDTHAALILVSSFTAFGTFLIKQFFMTVPDSLLEVARIDGAGEWYIFGRIMLPLSTPVLATTTIFSFRYFWNDFFNPLIYITSPEKKTLPLGLADFATEYFTYYGPQMAAALLSLIPVMIVFFSAQKYIVQGVATTGLKG